jgi:hypothetical protein
MVEANTMCRIAEQIQAIEKHLESAADLFGVGKNQTGSDSGSEALRTCFSHSDGNPRLSTCTPLIGTSSNDNFTCR